MWRDKIIIGNLIIVISSLERFKLAIISCKLFVLRLKRWFSWINEYVTSSKSTKDKKRFMRPYHYRLCLETFSERSQQRKIELEIYLFNTIYCKGVLKL